MPETITDKRTALYDEHVAAGGRMVSFAGFMMPVQYSSLTDEHLAVRSRAGIFDVSHMGEIFVRGPRALDFVQLFSCNDHAKLAIGRAQYTGLMYPQGTFVDDLLVHRLADDEYLLVVNAANTDKDFAYLSELADGEPGVEVENQSDRWAQIAVQGPLAQEILQPLTVVDLAAIKYYRFTWGEVAGHRALVARTGYTGEDGFEVYLEPSAAPGLWRALLAEGGPKGLLPAGLGARDTLRLEAGMPLYGNDIDDTTTPLEAGLGWIVKLDKGDFIGRDVLERQQETGIERRLVGFELLAPRHRAARPRRSCWARTTASRSATSPPAPACPRSASRWAWPTCRSMRRRPGGSSSSTSATGARGPASSSYRSTRGRRSRDFDSIGQRILWRW